MAVYLIRHGESEGNKARFFQGRIDTNLTEKGLVQAQTVGTWLKRQNVNIARAFCSPLKRASATADIITDILGCQSASVQADLIEYSAGKLEGFTAQENERNFPGHRNKPLGERDDYSEFGGESYEDVQTRLARFIATVEPVYSETEDILIVSHGGAMYQLLKLWCGWPTPRHYFQHISNCICYKLVVKDVADRSAGVLEWMVPLELMT